MFSVTRRKVKAQIYLPTAVQKVQKPNPFGCKITLLKRWNYQRIEYEPVELIQYEDCLDTYVPSFCEYLKPVKK